ncbi:MAG: hydroxyisourate hydrolase [Rhodobacteraceae bacterium]|nr:hydroxyisourate hydrolase [Paracoccaceae bacterium]
MPGFLTTHVLDTARGSPASGLGITLHKIVESKQILVREMTTNRDGRTDSPILPESDFELGQYILSFAAGSYLTKLDPDYNGFFDTIAIQFSMTEDDHYHVPLLLSPFGYSTYRGS